MGAEQGRCDHKEMLEAGIRKRQEMNSPLMSSEGVQLWQYVDFSPVKLISDFWSPEPLFQE